MSSFMFVLVVLILSINLELTCALRIARGVRHAAITHSSFSHLHLGRFLLQNGGISSSSLYSSAELDSVAAESSEETPVADAAGSSKSDGTPVGTSYCYCANCKTAYLLTPEELTQGGGRGARVVCTVCGKSWFQTAERLQVTDDKTELMDLSEEKLKEVKRILADTNTPRHPRTDKAGIFVGNLPYHFTDEDLSNLFAEYGLTNVNIVRDPEGNSKGFAFLEVALQEDADRCVKEMHNFYADRNRNLTCRIAEKRGGGGGRGGERSGGGGRGGGRSGGGGRGDGRGGGNNSSGAASGKVWVRK